MKRILAAALFASVPAAALSGSIVLTGHDPDYHATLGPDTTAARNLNARAIEFILDPLFNPIVAGGVDKFLFVESMNAPPSGHTRGVDGIVASGFSLGTDFEHHGAATLDAELDLLGTKYAGIVVASDFGGLLFQSELDILNARSGDIIDFLNNDDGGIFAMAEGNSGAGLTPNGNHFGFLPFVVSSSAVNQSENGNTLTAFGASMGLLTSDINGNFSHTVFNATGGLNVIDFDSAGRILSLGGRGQIDPNTGIVPLPPTLPLLLGGLLIAGLWRRRAAA